MAQERKRFKKERKKERNGAPALVMAQQADVTVGHARGHASCCYLLLLYSIGR
jgi:hypothetical protein